MQTRIMRSDVYNIIQLPYPATKSLLISTFKPLLYTSPKNLHTVNTHDYKYNYGAEIYFYYNISVDYS